MHAADIPISELLRNTASPIEENDPRYTQVFNDLQCNILTSHGKGAARYFFLSLRKGAGAISVFRDLCRILASRPSDSAAWIQRNDRLVTEYPEFFTTGELNQFRLLSEKEVRDLRRTVWAAKATGKESVPDGFEYALSFLLSRTGYEKLGITPPADPAFIEGMLNRGKSHLNDPAPNTWDDGFKDHSIDALLIVAYEPGEAPGHDAKLAAFKKRLSDCATAVWEERGSLLKAGADAATTNIEPFGFRDDLSQPLFYAEDLRFRAKLEGKAAASAQGGKWRSFEPLRTVLCPDPNGAKTHACGTYFVFRKLRQDIALFYQQAQQLSRALQRDPPTRSADGRSPEDQLADDIAAELMGRRVDGTPLAAATDLNDFDYRDAHGGAGCPLHAHVRKANRRDPAYRPHETRIVRRGIPYGPEIERREDGVPKLRENAISYKRPEQKGMDLGLLFLCAQSNIEQQFEAIQKWSNDSRGGADTVSGQPTLKNMIGLRDKNGKTAGLTIPYEQVVHLRGGEYFFAPSLGFLKSLV